VDAAEDAGLPGLIGGIVVGKTLKTVSYTKPGTRSLATTTTSSTDAGENFR
jgi:hypothetical protein